RKHHRNKHGHAGNLRALDPMRHFEKTHSSALLQRVCRTVLVGSGPALPFLPLGGVITPRRRPLKLPNAQIKASTPISIFVVAYVIHHATAANRAAAPGR